MVAVVAGLAVEFAVRAVVGAGRLIQRFPQVARPAGGFGLVRLLRLEAGPAQVAVEDGAANCCAKMVAAADPPAQYSLRPRSSAANTTASAATSGW